jgi:hypothetical protein
MSDPTAPSARPSPSLPPPASLTAPPGRLLKSTAIAALVAAVLLVTVVLPAEHGVDPTGIGRALGLTEMGEIKQALAKEAAADAVAHSNVPAAPLPVAEEPAVIPPPANPTPVAEPPDPVPSATSAPPTPASAPPTTNSHVTEVVLAPGAGKEIKLVMRKDARVTYSWSTDRGVVNFDAHADGPGIKYHGYEKGFGKPSGEGVLVAAFDGSHGWFWRNRGTETITVTLRTDGDYQELKRL